MKKLLVIMFSILVLATFADAADFALKAQWTPNTETDMSYYSLYRTDGTRTVVSACSHVNQPSLPLPAKVECLFTVTVPSGTEPTLSFVVTATDTAGNFSPDSDPATFRADAKPPVKPAALVIMLQ
jgi:hypothetical protein